MTSVNYLDLPGAVQIAFVCVFTIAAAVIDYRTKKIPNKLTLPMFALGWIYQLSFFQLAGLLDGLQGFLVGFGMFFVLWIIGSGGAGDAKLAGALSVWLGFRYTIYMIVASTIVVIIGTGMVTVYGMLTRGVFRTKERLLPSQSTGNKDSKGGKNIKLLTIQRDNRKLTGMTYALSVCIATILIMSVLVPNWPFNQARREAQAARERQRRPMAPQETERTTDAETQEDNLNGDKNAS